MLDYILRIDTTLHQNSILDNSFNPLRIRDILCNLPHSRKSIIIKLFDSPPTHRPPSEPPVGHQPQ